MRAFKPSTQDVEEERCLRVPDQPDLHSKFPDSRGYIKKPCLKKENQKHTHTHTHTHPHRHLSFWKNALVRYTVSTHSLTHSDPSSNMVLILYRQVISYYTGKETMAQGTRSAGQVRVL